MARIAWLTDLHLDFIEPDTAIADFCRSVADCPSDVVLVGGDISTAASLEAHLRQLEAAVQRPIYFVLGNHDFYGGRIADGRGGVSELSRSRSCSAATRTVPGSFMCGRISRFISARRSTDRPRSNRTLF